MNKEIKEPEKSICIIGGGIMGLTSAYFLKNYFKVTVIEPNQYAMGASEKNAGCIALNLPPWTLKNPWTIMLDNLNIYKRTVEGNSSVFSLFNIRNLFDLEFIKWARMFMKSRKESLVYT